MPDVITTPDPHAVDETPSVYSLSADQIALIKALHFLSEFQLAHTAKTAPDVPEAFTGTVLPTVAGSSWLGGAARRDEIQGLLDLHAKLTGIAQVVAPLARLVSQNLLATDAKLAAHSGEVLKLATMRKATEPQLLVGVAGTRDWTKKHHPGHGTTPAPAPKP